jgi:hypothetical protein
MDANLVEYFGSRRNQTWLTVHLGASKKIEQGVSYECH